MIATLITEAHPSWMGDTNVYALDTPYQGHTHVAVAVHAVEYGQWQNGGTEITGCDETGHADSLDALYQSYVILTHAEALSEIGYTL